MPRRFFRRTVVSLLVVLAFAVVSAPAGAQGGRSWATRAADPTLVERVGRVLGFLMSLWGKTGCQIDPNGLCASVPSTGDRKDEGCNIDPDGRCLSAPAVLSQEQGDEGCNIDPNGSCR